MRYLSKIIFIKSAHIPYAEVKLDGNVHFIGTQGVGKSTLLRALLFFYNADKQKLGIPKEKRGFDSFYFEFPNSYIIYEVQRETGAYLVACFRSQGRAAFRFIDAPYDRSYFIDENGMPYADWNVIRDKIGVAHSVSRIVDKYEEYRDIIFGNRRAVSQEFYKFAITESAKYQNIPRTIQNVFLNSKLDADFIKDTIINSMNNDEVQIDLAYYRSQVSMFEPIGGSAPKYTGMNIINPLACILAGGLLLDHIGQPEAALAIEAAVVKYIGSPEFPGLSASEIKAKGMTTQRIGDIVAGSL